MNSAIMSAVDRLAADLNGEDVYADDCQRKDDLRTVLVKLTLLDRAEVEREEWEAYRRGPWGWQSEV
jgi:hypothetical protein